MKPLARPVLTINDAFWVPRLTRNAQVPIFQQWKQLQQSRCVENLCFSQKVERAFGRAISTNNLCHYPGVRHLIPDHGQDGR